MPPCKEKGPSKTAATKMETKLFGIGIDNGINFCFDWYYWNSQTCLLEGGISKVLFLLYILCKSML